ncbi:MAG: NirD/YgiW/YdeI family stress tolerance protein [Methylophilaceae bacterium]
MIINSKSSAISMACAIIIFATATSHAEYIGPSAHKTIESVAEILKNPKDDQRVMLRGYLIKQVGPEKYIFSDGSNEIRVEIDAEDFHGLTVDAKTRVEIIGEVEKDFLVSPEIDVNVIRTSPK